MIPPRSGFLGQQTGTGDPLPSQLGPLPDPFGPVASKPLPVTPARRRVAI